MSTRAQVRVDHGIPTGGQFAISARPEAGGVDLGAAVPKAATATQRKAITDLYQAGNLWPNSRDSRAYTRQLVDSLVVAGVARWAPWRLGSGVLPHVVPAAKATFGDDGSILVTVPGGATASHAGALAQGLFARASGLSPWGIAPSVRTSPEGTTETGELQFRVTRR